MGGRSHRAVVALLVLAVGLAAGGAPRAAPKGKAPPGVDIKGITDKLRSKDPAILSEGIASATAVGRAAPSLAPPVEELLKRGASVDVMRAAIEALGAVGQPSSSAV